MKRCTGIALALFSVLLLGAASFKAFSLKPVDEASLQPDFEVFRAGLVTAVKNRDLEAFLALVDPAVRVGAGRESGVAALRSQWKLDQSPRDSRLWPYLGRILELGGTFDGDVFTAPYIHSRWPADYPRDEFGFVSGTNVNIRSRAELKAPVVKQASHEMVRFVWDTFAAPGSATVGGETWPWVKVSLSTGQEGYVWGRFFHGGLDYRAEFRKVDGNWKLSALVAGE